MQQLIPIECGYQFKPFLERGVVAAFSTRPLNFSSKTGTRDKAAADLLDACGLAPDRFVLPKQVHGSNIAEIDGRYFTAQSHPPIDHTDALTSNAAAITLGVLIADCLPVFLYDEAKKVIAIVHAGWKGTRLNIVHNTLAYMKRRYRTSYDDVIAGLGPSLRPCCYEVGEEFTGFFPKYTVQKNGAYHFDLAAANRATLCELGVLPEKIFDCGFCTSCMEDAFFSYRRQKEASGRMAAVVSMIEQKEKK